MYAYKYFNFQIDKPYRSRDGVIWKILEADERTDTIIAKHLSV